MDRDYSTTNEKLQKLINYICLKKYLIRLINLSVSAIFICWGIYAVYNLFQDPESNLATYLMFSNLVFVSFAMYIGELNQRLLVDLFLVEFAASAGEYDLLENGVDWTDSEIAIESIISMYKIRGES